MQSGINNFCLFLDLWRRNWRSTISDYWMSPTTQFDINSYARRDILGICWKGIRSPSKNMLVCVWPVLIYVFSFQIYIYRGIEGFTTFSHFSFSTRVTDMQAFMVPSMPTHSCERTFLALSMNQDIIFLEAIATGYCGLEVSLDCT